ncbi:hypothetical protein GYB22_03120 [bacterium]|nr:hypothetical protein [bacterium]
MKQYKIGFGMSHSIFLESFKRTPDPKLPLNGIISIEFPLNSEASIDVRAWSFFSFIRFPDREFDVMKRDYISGAISYKRWLSKGQHLSQSLLFGAAYRYGSEFISYNTANSHHSSRIYYISNVGILAGLTNEIKLSPRLSLATDVCYTYNFMLQQNFSPVENSALSRNVIVFSARLVGVFGSLIEH